VKENTMPATNTAHDAEALRLANRFLDALRASKTDDARIIITALADIDAGNEEPPAF
jgi:hypothetical protein